AARRRDRLRVADRVPVELGDPVHKFRQKIGRLMGMAIPAFVSCSVVEPEVGPEVDEGDASGEDRGRDLLALPMRKRGKDQIDAVQRPLVEMLKIRLRVSNGKMRVHRGERLSGLAVAEQLRGRELGMRGDQPQQLAADIARGSKDCRPNHGARPYAGNCINMQVYVYSCT